MPTWVFALQMAELWGVPPWEIMEHEGSLMWYSRLAFYRKQQKYVADLLAERTP